MRTEQFTGLLKKLGLGPSSKRAAESLGLSLRQLQRITGGKSPVPGPVALLAIAYSKHGLPTRPWNPDVDRNDAIKDATSRLLASMYRSAAPPVPPAAPPAPKPDPAVLAEAASAAKMQRAEKAGALAQKRLRRVANTTS
jgi:hypothetical protein